MIMMTDMNIVKTAIQSLLVFSVMLMMAMAMTGTRFSDIPVLFN